MKKRLEKNERGFNYILLVGGPHHHRRHKVWVNRTLVNGEGEEIEFPIRGASVVKTEKGAWVIRPGSFVVYLIEIESGYRGTASIEEVAGGEILLSDETYHSPRGNLGETAWALVQAEGQIRVRGTRTGRRVVNNEVEFTILPNGEIMDAKEEGLEELL